MWSILSSLPSIYTVNTRQIPHGPQNCPKVAVFVIQSNFLHSFWNKSIFSGSRLHVQNLPNSLKGILSTSCVIFSYPKLLSISVLTFIKWRFTPSYAAKDTIFWQKRPKTIVIVIIVRMTIFKYIHMAFLFYASWACALLKNNKQHVGRESFNTW